MTHRVCAKGYPGATRLPLHQLLRAETSRHMKSALAKAPAVFEWDNIGQSVTAGPPFGLNAPFVSLHIQHERAKSGGPCVSPNPVKRAEK